MAHNDPYDSYAGITLIVLLLSRRKEFDMFLTETHFHTSLSSPCANVPPEEALAAYINCGYNALVVTDHFSRMCREYYGIEDNSEWVDRFLSGYRYLKQMMTSMHVLLGMEIHFDENATIILCLAFQRRICINTPPCTNGAFESFTAMHTSVDGWLFRRIPFGMV